MLTLEDGVREAITWGGDGDVRVVVFSEERAEEGAEIAKRLHKSLGDFCKRTPDRITFQVETDPIEKTRYYEGYVFHY